jgi:retinol-binding protein 3
LAAPRWYAAEKTKFKPCESGVWVKNAKPLNNLLGAKLLAVVSKENMNEIGTNIVNEVICNLSEKLRAYYVFPHIAEEICLNLQKHLENGTYQDITEGEFLAFALTTHLQEVNQDKHLWVRWHSDPLPDHEGSLLKNQQKMKEWQQKARLENYGIHKVERLPGNIGYIDIRYFYRTSWGSGETIVAAMNLLANMSIVLIDLRKCMGGNPSAVVLFCSYFFDEEPVHLNSLYWRENEITEQYWTQAYVPGKRMIEQPVYILTSKDTFSGGEEFCYNLQTRQRAKIIGEVTGGGAHPGSPYRLHPHFEVFIPNGRAINPVSNQNWEGIGIQPDILVSEDQAQRVAYKMALNSIVDEVSQLESRPYLMRLEEAKIALQKLSDA